MSSRLWLFNRPTEARLAASAMSAATSMTDARTASGWNNRPKASRPMSNEMAIKRGGVQKRRKNLSPLETIGMPRRWRPPAKPASEDRDAQRTGVHEVVHGISQKRQTPRQKTAGQLHQRNRDVQRGTKP